MSEQNDERETDTDRPKEEVASDAPETDPDAVMQAQQQAEATGAVQPQSMADGSPEPDGPDSALPPVQ